MSPTARSMIQGVRQLRQPLQQPVVRAGAIVHQRLQRHEPLSRSEFLWAEGLLVRAGSDRDEQQFVLAGPPFEAVALKGGEHQQLQGRIIERADPAVDENAFDHGTVARGNLDLLGLEIGGGRGARPNHLRQLQGAVLRRIARARAVRERPRTAGVEPLGHDHEARFDAVARKRRVCAEPFVQRRLKRLREETSAKRFLLALSG